LESIFLKRGANTATFMLDRLTAFPRFQVAGYMYQRERCV
jgi:hypothetical protein